MKTRILMSSMLVLALFTLACSKQVPRQQDSHFDSFYDKTRHIMSPEEIEIYQHLPDNASKEEFINEFWSKRDPDPSTEENEARESFEERIEYANRWFNERKGKNRGWDTLRGRILLQLGFPDERRWGQMRLVVSDQSRRDIPTEIWYYYRHQLMLTFSDRNGYGSFELESTPATLLTAIDNSKFAIDSAMFPNVKHAFKFTADYHDNQIEVTIPSKRLFFNEEGEQLTANLSFTIFVYKDYRKIDTFTKEIRSTEEKENLLTKKNITLTIPYKPQEPGQYHLDIVGKDLGANQRYRNFCQIKK